METLLRSTCAIYDVNGECACEDFEGEYCYRLYDWDIEKNIGEERCYSPYNKNEGFCSILKKYMPRGFCLSQFKKNAPCICKNPPKQMSLFIESHTPKIL